MCGGDVAVLSNYLFIRLFRELGVAWWHKDVGQVISYLGWPVWSPAVPLYALTKVSHSTLKWLCSPHSRRWYQPRAATLWNWEDNRGLGRK